jgi:hypothetical protein
MSSKYKLRGVSADKEDVHEAIKGLDKGLYPSAFCKILPDLAGNDLIILQHHACRYSRYKVFACIYVLERDG